MGKGPSQGPVCAASLFRPDVTLWPSSAIPLTPLIQRRDGAAMNLPNPRVVLLSFLSLVLAATWVIVILVALHVSSVVLNTLDMIVELAAMS